jgi:hypothetical protein
VENQEYLPLTDAAKELHLSRERCLRLVTTGHLIGRRDQSSWWTVSRASVERLKAELAHARAPGSAA